MSNKKEHYHYHNLSPKYQFYQFFAIIIVKDATIFKKPDYEYQSKLFISAYLNDNGEKLKIQI